MKVKIINMLLFFWLFISTPFLLAGAVSFSNSSDINYYPWIFMIIQIFFIIWFGAIDTTSKQNASQGGKNE